MPQYVILTDHTPDICPSSNSRSRARAIDGIAYVLNCSNVEATKRIVGNQKNRVLLQLST